MKTHTAVSLAAGIVLAACTAATAADSALQTQARTLLAAGKANLVTVNSLSKLDMGSSASIKLNGMEEAQKASSVGLVLDASGLTVVSYSSLNPMDRVVGAINAKLAESTEPAASSISPKATMSQVKMRMADGTEIPARMVYVDKEVDLAFVVPETKDSTNLPAFTPAAVDAAVTARELDDVILVSRHGKEFGYQGIVLLGNVTAVVSKPRAMYDLSAGASLGSPVYLANGKLLGILTAYQSSSSSALMMGTEVMVVPVAEIAKLMVEAKKAAEKKPEPPAKTESKSDDKESKEGDTESKSDEPKSDKTEK